MNQIWAYRKAIIAGLVAGLTALATALPDGVSGPEVITIILAIIAGSGITYAVPNKAEKSDEEILGTNTEDEVKYDA